ncbi:copper-binding protein [Jeongeupia wiesaeckerbachi]|uniref:copper-binding protein n=1 Tax=Jeongeupia wiesaeckerbachi TaxID=3051218 RepID=UPI003D803577
MQKRFALVALVATLWLGAAQAQSDYTDGEVRKIDKANGKITLKHGDIKSLDMPGMTMVFTMRDAAQLDAVKPGDKVRFAVVNEGGKLVVTELLAQ